jgi:hypothetical protein
MATSYAYNNDTRKWGLFARSITKRPELITHFEKQGIKKSELEKVSTTEDDARAADNAQKDAEQKLTSLTPQIKTAQEALLESFSVLKLRVPNAARDLKEANDPESAKALLELNFSEKAIPRIPGQPEEVIQESTTPAAPAEGATVEPVTPSPEEEPEDRESRAQKAIANAAIRTEEYLRDKTAVVKALIERMMPADFMEALKKNGDKLMHLREERILFLERKKKATQAEHAAVRAHIEARGIIEPTVSSLCSKESAIDALAVEHLGRKSAQKKE